MFLDKKDVYLCFMVYLQNNRQVFRLYHDSKGLKVRRHKQGKEYYNYLISSCCFFDMKDAHGVIQHAGCL